MVLRSFSEAWTDSKVRLFYDVRTTNGKLFVQQKMNRVCPDEIRRITSRSSESEAWASRYDLYVHFVYIIRSIEKPQQVYVGIASDVKSRLIKHNEGANKHTAKFKPWRLVWFCAYPSKNRAVIFEKYLKSSSGIAFRRKRLM